MNAAEPAATPLLRPSFDLIDAAFLGRLERTAAAALPEQVLPAVEPAAVSPVVPPTGVTVEPVPDLEPDSVLDRLLRLVPDAWERVADRIEAAGRQGHRVIAFAGGRRGEGRTTLMAGVAATLAARGRPVRCMTPGQAVPCGNVDREMPMLVDAGVWFPPGPLRMDRIAALAQGCDAVILVRRADEAPCPARGEALVHVGVACLGEVETFADP